MSRKVVEIKFAARAPAAERSSPNTSDAPDQWVNAGASFSTERDDPVEISDVIPTPTALTALEPYEPRSRWAAAERSRQLVCEVLHPGHQSFRALTSVAESNLILMLGVQDISREWIAVARAGALRNFDALGELLACRCPQVAFDLQTGLARDHLEDGSSALARIGRMSTRVADEASKVVAA